MWKLWTSDTWPEWTSMPHSVKLAGAVVIGGATLVLVVRRITSIASQKKVYPKDTVILHQIGRGPWAPSLSPFAVKLETYLRMAKIPYQNDHEVKPGPKGKIPWIEYNGEIVSDSQFSIEFLNKQFNQDLNKNYTEEQIAIGRAFQKMLEENTFWAAALFRFCFDEGDFWSCKEAPFSRNPLTVYMIKRTIRQYTHAHGIGRHSKEDVKKILVEDINALSTFLGKKKFLLGDTPSEVDCAVFGLLSNMRWHSFGNSIGSLMEDLPNLCDYCERMKTKFWPDWDDCITHGSTTVPTR